MSKSPEEYFTAQDFSAQPREGKGFSPAERAFMAKYMGLDCENAPEQPGLDDAGAKPLPGAPLAAVPATKEEPGVAGPAAEEKSAPPEAVNEESDAPAPQERTPSAVEGLFGTAQGYTPAEIYLEETLKKEKEIQMVGFFLGEQEFTIPTAAVQEVIRAMPIARLPAAPSFVAGVINLRGRVTPLVELREILEVRSPRREENRFIIICRRQGLQIGMLIEKVHTMYRVPQTDIEWGIETHLGINGECVAGLFKQNEQLVSIVSVDRVIADVLK